MSMRIVVTGRQGQVARALAEVEPTPNVEIINLGRPQLDLAAPETVGPALCAAAPDIVVNAAAYTAVDQAEREPEIASAVNGIGAGAVAEAAHALGVPVIHLSTDYVFDGEKDGFYTQRDQPNPQSAYAASKLKGEQRAQLAWANTIVVRSGYIFGPGGTNPTTKPGQINPFYQAPAGSPGSTTSETVNWVDLMGNGASGTDFGKSLSFMDER